MQEFFEPSKFELLIFNFNKLHNCQKREIFNEQKEFEKSRFVNNFFLK
jgi:hypothetical protein